jgi:hypothetical protein
MLLAAEAIVSEQNSRAQQQYLQRAREHTDRELNPTSPSVRHSASAVSMADLLGTPPGKTTQQQQGDEAAGSLSPAPAVIAPSGYEELDDLLAMEIRLVHTRSISLLCIITQIFIAHH